FIYDPFTPGQNSDGTGRNVFCGPLGSVPAASCTGTTNGASNQFLVPITIGARQVISPAALKILSAFPPPTNSGTSALAGALNCLNNFLGAGAGPSNQNSFDVRIDYAANQSTSVFGRYSFNHFSLSGAPSLGAVGGVGFGPGGLAGSSIVHNYSLALGVTKTFSSSLLGDFRFGYFQYNPITHKPAAGKAAMTGFGMPHLNLGRSFTVCLG